MVQHPHLRDENTETHRRKALPLKLGSGWQLDENPASWHLVVLLSWKLIKTELWFLTFRLQVEFLSRYFVLGKKKPQIKRITRQFTLGSGALEPKRIDQTFPPFAKKNYKEQRALFILVSFAPDFSHLLIPSWLSTLLMLLSDLMSQRVQKTRLSLWQLFKQPKGVTERGVHGEATFLLWFLSFFVLFLGEDHSFWIFSFISYVGFLWFYNWRKPSLLRIPKPTPWINGVLWPS